MLVAFQNGLSRYLPLFPCAGGEGLEPSVEHDEG
jgi:hypothetical protein